MVKPPYRVYIITGFVISGWLFFFPGIIKLPDEHAVKWKAVQIPPKKLKYIYIGLEVKRKIINSKCKILVN